MQEAKSAMEALIEYIKALTPAQADKLVEKMPLLERMKEMTGNQLTFMDAFTERICGAVANEKSL